MDLNSQPPITSAPPVAGQNFQPPQAKHEIKFPPYVLALGVVTVLAFLFGLIRLPHSIGLGINFAKGKKAIEQGNGKRAVQKLKPIVDEYKDAEDVRVELFRAYVMDGDSEGANAQYNYFEGRTVSKELSAQLDEIASQADAKFKGGDK